jgi:hypothetical protein
MKTDEIIELLHTIKDLQFKQRDLLIEIRDTIRELMREEQ